jgi:predicted phage terminase large subunit-like protein
VLVYHAEIPWPQLRVVRAWDLASTKPTRANRDPDWTAGCLYGTSDGEFYVIDVYRFREAPGPGEQLLAATMQADDAMLVRRVPIRVEQEGGASGSWSIDGMARRLFPGRDFDGVRPSASKAERAKPVAITAWRGHLHVLDGPYLDEFLDELEIFPPAPGEGHDDQVDALSLAHWYLTDGDRGLTEGTGPQATEKPNEWARPGETQSVTVGTEDEGEGWGAL